MRVKRVLGFDIYRVKVVQSHSKMIIVTRLVIELPLTLVSMHL